MRKISILALLLIMVVVPVFARDIYYAKGDSVFTFRGGVSFPGFISFYNDSERGTVTLSDTHMKLGGYAAISYQGYLTERLALGGALAYNFNYSMSKMLLTTVPITAKLSYYPIQTGKFDLSFSADMGIAFLRYDNGKFLSPYLSFTVQPTVFVSETWGIGFESGIMLTAEFYGEKNIKHVDNAFCGLLPVNVVVAYRH